MTLTPEQILQECLKEAGDDIESGLTAAQYVLNLHPLLFSVTKDFDKPKLKPLVNAAFAYDIKNKKAQSILNKSVKSLRELTKSAKEELAKTLDSYQEDNGTSILEFIDKYRLSLTDLLTDTHLNSIQEGVNQVASKVPTLDISNTSSSKSMYEAARTKATAIAGVNATETLTKIRDVVARTIEEGADHETFRQKVMDSMEQGTLLSNAHQETILRMVTQTAFSDGQMSVLNHPEVREKFPYSQYESIHDDRARHNHNELDTSGINGTNVYRTDDPVFQQFRPPWDFNCRCSWKPLTVSQAANLGVKEAKQWRETGIPPSDEDKAFVEQPPFQPPESFQRSLESAPLSIKLSSQPITLFSSSFSRDVHGREHRGKGPGGGQFVSSNNTNSKETTKRKDSPFKSKPNLSEEQLRELDDLLEQLESKPDKPKNTDNTPKISITKAPKRTTGIIRKVINVLSKLLGK